MLAEAVMHVGQACVRVSDLLYTFRALEGKLSNSEVTVQQA